MNGNDDDVPNGVQIPQQSEVTQPRSSEGIKEEATTLPTQFYSKHTANNLHENNKKYNNKKKRNKGKPKEKKLFVYGNYDAYYLSRTPGDQTQEFSVDPRVKFFKKEWFEARDCLDIGCNAGHLPIYIAYNYQPRRILGVDIDPILVGQAQDAIKATYESLLNDEEDTTTTAKQLPKRIKFSENDTETEITIPTTTTTISTTTTTTATATATATATNEENQTTTQTLQLTKLDQTNEGLQNTELQAIQTNTEHHTKITSNNDTQHTHTQTSTSTQTTTLLLQTTIQVDNTIESNHSESSSNDSNTSVMKTTSEVFPNNISIRQENYLETESAERFDTILCMSVTKWIHFNWGDEGVKKLFQKVYSQLNAGGIFILEPQPWSSYKKKHSLTPQIKQNYQNIQFRPTEFINYLLSIGFVGHEVLCNPDKAQGFDREIYLFRK